MIPDFTPSGVLPPFVGDTPTRRANMAPYAVSLVDIAVRFANTPERLEIFRGLLAYRQALRDIGFVNGFQWLDGSFVEDVEGVRGRPPGDLDVVTFSDRPVGNADPIAWGDFVNANLDVLDPREAKRRFKCEAFLIDFQKQPHLLCDDTRYWFGLFSHQRESYHWKGMLKVGLQADDAAALDYLQQGANN